MKHWQETNEILDRLAELTAAGQHAAIACVVAISGSAYRRPGARLLIAADGSTLGGISGGCLEEDVRQAGLGAIEGGGCRLLHYETGDDDEALWGLGLGCDGEVDVLVAPSTRPGFHQAAGRLRALLGGDNAFAAVTVLGTTSSSAAGEGTVTSIDGRMLILGSNPDVAANTGDAEVDDALLAAANDAADAGASRIVLVDGVRAFVEVFEPPPYLVICGAGDDAMPMVRTAADAGFRVLVVDHRPAYLATDRFPSAWRLVEALPDDALDIPAGADTFVVLKTHNLARDKAWARRFLAAPIPYLGLLGPRARCEEIADEAAAHDRERIFAPVGLDLGAEGPEQVGLAVVAELLALRSGRSPGHLKDRDAPIHDREQ